MLGWPMFNSSKIVYIRPEMTKKKKSMTFFLNKQKVSPSECFFDGHDDMI